MRELLQRYGFGSEIIDWKYFDKGFQPGRERGYAWIHQDRVEGMIGLIPFSLAGPSGAGQCAWTCDWFVGEAKQHPGIGVLLLKKAIQHEGLLATLGGNEVTSRIVPRMAAHTDPSGCVELTLPLRVGGTHFYSRVQRRVPNAAVRAIGNVRLPRRWQARDTGGLTVSSQSGISPAVLDLLAERPSEGWSPAYDSGHVEWQLVRCPAVESASACARDGANVHAASMVWRARTDRGSWRVSLLQRPAAADAARRVIEETVRLVTKERGQVLTTLVGARDEETLDALRAAGFRQTERTLPLYVLAKDAAVPITGFRRVSYLDSDLGYRF